jgi:DNA processing protein
MTESEAGKKFSKVGDTGENQQERINWIRLARSYNIGNLTFFKLIRAYKTATNAIKNIADFSYRCNLKKKIEIYSEETVLKEIKACEKFGAEIILFNDKNYPKRLKEIADPPPIITVKGNKKLLNSNIIAMVGARNSSSYALKQAQKLAKELGENDLIIASGLARGIDTACHLASLKTGTIAVTAGGIDNIYPPENSRLYQEIFQDGIIITEGQFGEAPKSQNFPQRNRIISGISLGVIVVEAGMKSGTLITARLAGEQGREVFAIPGHPNDPKSEGNIKLIEDGAIPVNSYEDVLRELEHIKKERIFRYGFADSENANRNNKNNVIHINDSNEDKTKSPKNKFKNPLQKYTDKSQQKTNKPTNNLHKLILSKLGRIPIFVDILIDDLKQDAQSINIALMELELNGEISIKNGKVELV